MTQRYAHLSNESLMSAASCASSFNIKQIDNHKMLAVILLTILTKGIKYSII